MDNKHYHKSVNFKHNDVNDMRLYEQLKKLPHGEFSRITKAMWEERLRKEEQK